MQTFKKHNSVRLLEMAQKLKDPDYIWDDVNEETKTLLIIEEKNNHADLIRWRNFQKHPYSSPKNRFCPQPITIINIHDYPVDSIKNLKGLPSKMPNLNHIDIRYVKIRSLEGFPAHLPKLQLFSVMDSEISSLESLPQKLPALKSFAITKCPVSSLKGMPKSLPNLESLRLGCQITNLKYFPQSLPNLKKLNIASPHLTSLRFMPQNLPNLKSLSLGTKLTTLKGMPKKIPALKELNITWNNLSSLEHLPEVVNIHLNKFYFNPKTFRTLSGIKNRKFFNHIAFYEHQDEFINLHFKGLKLIKEHHKHIEETVFDDETQEHINLSYWEKDPVKYDELVKYYAKTPLELSQQYINNQKDSPTNQKLLTKDELERLAWEAGHEERQLLESNLQPDDPIVKNINIRFSVEINNGFDIKI